jgi:hypothetical protein
MSHSSCPSRRRLELTSRLMELCSWLEHTHHSATSSLFSLSMIERGTMLEGLTRLNAVHAITPCLHNSRKLLLPLAHDGKPSGLVARKRIANALFTIAVSIGRLAEDLAAAGDSRIDADALSLVTRARVVREGAVGILRSPTGQMSSPQRQQPPSGLASLHRVLVAAMCSLFVACAETGSDSVTEDDRPEGHAGSAEQSLIADNAEQSRIRQTLIYAIPLAIHREYFQAAEEPTPSKTPDGIGAFQYFTGSVGRGAIYTHAYPVSPPPAPPNYYNGVTPKRATANATFPIYGAFLQAFEAWGWETRIGYPASPEHDAEDRTERATCKSQGGTRQQIFGHVAWETPTGGKEGGQVVLCWSAERGVWALPGEVGDALAQGRPLIVTGP